MGSQNKTKRQETIKAYKRQNGLCYLCGDAMKLSGDPFHPRFATADHVVPKSHGGPIKGNIKAACRECNNFRGNRPVDDFDKDQGRDIKAAKKLKEYQSMMSR